GMAVRNGLIAALDIGTTKVCCFIARVENGLPRVVGIGLQASRGMRWGTVVDMEATEGTIRAAVDIAEKMCGETIRQVFVS
ncbi:cell division protein FtsA, partial [Acinetobacter baumannii]